MPTKKKKTKKAIAKTKPRAKKKERGLVIPKPQNAIADTNYLSRQRIDLIKRTVAKGATDDELKLFLLVCQRSKLDPFMKQIHLIKFKLKDGTEQASIMTGIDGLRSVAERTGFYAGSDDPVFDDEKAPKRATVTVYKIVSGVRCPFVGTARWDEFFPKLEKNQWAWNKMPTVMLGKCAEAQALRKAFPQVMGQLYIAEEIQPKEDGDSPDMSPTEAYREACAMIDSAKDKTFLLQIRDRIKKSKIFDKQDQGLLVEKVDRKVESLNG